MSDTHDHPTKEVLGKDLDHTQASDATPVTSVTVIIEGGLVRDVLGASYDVLDLDILDGGDLEDVEELLGSAELLLPEGTDRDGILEEISDALKEA